MDSVDLYGFPSISNCFALRHCFDRLGFETTRTTFRGGASHSTRATVENFKKSRQLGNSFLARAGESESLIISSSWHSVQGPRGIEQRSDQRAARDYALYRNPCWIFRLAWLPGKHPIATQCQSENPTSRLFASRLCEA